MSDIHTTYNGKRGYFTIRSTEEQIYPMGIFASISDAKKFAGQFHKGHLFKDVFVPDNWIFSARRYARAGE